MSEMTLNDAVPEDFLGDTNAILICLLGRFRLLRAGRPIAVPGRGKLESLLGILALRQVYSAPRELLLSVLWPNSDADLAGQSLNSLVYSLHKTLGKALGGPSPIVCAEGYYRLNVEAGVSSDVARFEALADAGDRHRNAEQIGTAMECYCQALKLYRGDLCLVTDVEFVIRRENLRARYLTILARLADYRYLQGDHSASLAYALKLLSGDPCREDAHRLIMRCYLRLGERAQALRQYRLCQEILRREFDAQPEPATTELFDRIRLEPGGV
jgi:DNA-binding SARP family transcriptional activator